MGLRLDRQRHCRARGRLAPDALNPRRTHAPSYRFSLTSYPGCEQEPALSPDGHRVAFSWCGGDGQHYDIYVTQANSETPLRITDDPGYESHPAWSPDGNTIAFARSGPERGIYAVPSIGGPARRLCPTTGPVVGLDWSPDGRSIAFSSSPEPGAFLQILLLSRETLEVKPLVRPSPEFTCAFHPVFSPDGRSIAFVRSDLSGSQDVHVASRNGETSRRLTFTQRRITGLDWSADSRSILFVAAPGARYDLWRISASGGPVTWMPTAGRQVTSLTIADRDNRMVYEELHYDRDIWVQTTGAPGAVCLIGSTRQDWAPRFAPGGQRLAFLSTRSGEREIWVSRADGTDPRQLTHVNGRDVTPPCWSPDGEHLAFATTGGGTFNAHTIDLDTGETRRVPGGDDHQIPFVWSIDGRTLYCNRSSARGWEIWALPLEGGAPQCIAGDARSLVPQVGPAHALYYLRADSLGIWRMAPDGSGQTRIVPGPKLTRWREELIMGDAAYFIRPEAAGDVLGRFDFTSQAETVLGPLPQGAHELAVPADRDRAVFSRYRGIASDLTLIPRFD